MASLVDVEVIEIRPNGVLVRILENNQVGLIRRRDLSKDRRVGVIPPIPEAGKPFKAEIIRAGKGDRYPHLRPHDERDPWKEAKQKYGKGQVVRGEVVNVRRFGVFVQIEPGIDAIVRPEGIPIPRGKWLEHVLSVGDQVQGVVTEFNLRRRQVEISLLQRLQDLSPLPPERRQEEQHKLFRDELAPSEPTSAALDIQPEKDKRKAGSYRYHPPIPDPKRLLVIDNNSADLRRICQHLKKTCELETDGAESGKQAVGMINLGRPYGLAVIDLLLDNEHGARVAEQLLTLKPNLEILFTSADPLAEEDLPSIGGRRFPFVFKDPEEIAEQVDRLRSGYWEEIREINGAAYQGHGSFIRQLGMEAFARRPLSEVLEQMLANLKQKTGTSHCMVLETDSINKTVSILAIVPPLPASIEKRSLDGLYYSPVRDVVEDEQEFYRTNITQDRDLQYRYFFPLLAFKVCLGIPLAIPDLVTRHALFLLDEQRVELDLEDLDRARISAKSIEIALERALLVDYMRRYADDFSKGLLFRSLVHELSNKLEGMAVAEDLLTLLQRLETIEEAAEYSNQMAKIKEATEKIVRAEQEYRGLLSAYRRMVRGDLEAVDVNEVVRKVAYQMEAEARGKATICLEEHPSIPKAYAVRSRLEQIVENLLLNAIQQIDAQRETMAQIAEAKGEKDKALLQHGVITIQTRYLGPSIPYPVQIIIMDSGPGIHYQDQQRIFLLDVSTREEGHGLGLFISHNLAEAMGGHLRLADSVIFAGSAFVIELPAFFENGG